MGGTGEMIRSRRFAEGVAVKLLGLRGGVTLVAASGMCVSACGGADDIASTVPVVETTTGPASSTRVSTLGTATSMPPAVSTTVPPSTTLPATTAPSTTASSVTAPSVPTAIPGADQLAGGADPEELANIEAHRSLWESMQPTEYTMRIDRPVEGSSAMYTDCATSNPLRVVVVDRGPVEVTGLTSGCSLPADESVPTVEGLFDLRGHGGCRGRAFHPLGRPMGVRQFDRRVRGEFWRLRRRALARPCRGARTRRCRGGGGARSSTPQMGCESPIRLLVRPPHRGLHPVGRHVPHHRRRRATRRDRTNRRTAVRRDAGRRTARNDRGGVRCHHREP